MTRFAISTIRNVNDTRPRLVSATWEELCERLSHHTSYPAKEAAPLWCPAAWALGRPREKDNLEKGNLTEVCCFVAEFDDGTRPDDLRDRLRSEDGEPLAHIIHSSYNHTTTSPRFRLVVPFTGPVPAEEWKTDYWPRLSYWFCDNRNDAATKDAARFYFLPSCPPDRMKDAFFRVQEGGFLDMNTLPDLPTKANPAAPMYTPSAGNGEGLPGKEFNAVTTPDEVLAMLQGIGWEELYRSGDVISVIRPGKKIRTRSGTIGNNGPNVFYCFSDSAPPLEPRTSYTPFALLATLEHNGDFSAAAKALAATGHGEPFEPVRSVALSWDDDDAEETTDLDMVASGKPWTDFGNAERLILRHGSDLRYNPAVGWMVWDERRWAEDASGERIRRMKHAVRRIDLEAAAKSKQAARATDKRERQEYRYIAKELLAWAKKSESLSKVKAALELAKNESGVHVKPDELDMDPWLLNCPNGTLELRSGCLREHRQSDLITHLCPAPFDPDALCPLWNAFLKRILPDEAVRFYVQQMAGYSLTGDVSLQNLMFLWGGGQNGKSTFITTLLSMIGEYGRQASSDLLVARRTEAVREDIAFLAGRRMVATVEVDEGRVLAEALMKQLTGGDMMTGRRLYQNSFEFRPTFKIWLAANHRPQVKVGGKSVWRRIKLIPFTQTITEREKDSELPEKLKVELSGILAWAVRGCLSWQRDGIQEPEAVRAGTEEYRQETDLIGLFVKECCHCGEGERIRPNELYHAYCRWCEERRERPKSLAAFGTQLSDRGVGKVTLKGYPHYQGIGLRPENLEDDPQEGLWTAT